MLGLVLDTLCKGTRDYQALGRGRKSYDALGNEGRGKSQSNDRVMLGPVTMATGMGSVPCGRAAYNTEGLPENVTMATMAKSQLQSPGRYGDRMGRLYAQKSKLSLERG